MLMRAGVHVNNLNGVVHGTAKSGTSCAALSPAAHVCTCGHALKQLRTHVFLTNGLCLIQMCCVDQCVTSNRSYMDTRGVLAKKSSPTALQAPRLSMTWSSTLSPPCAGEGMGDHRGPG